MVASAETSDGLIAWLGAAGVDSAALGGKAASLDRLVRFGFRVPPGFCLTTGAFAAHLSSVSGIDALFRALPDEAARSALVATVADSPAPLAVCAALAAALAKLPPGSALAVRSSAIGEDGAVASFAGLHETELGLRADEVEAAVRRCWASLWSAPAVAYRVRRGVPLDDASMAVVVQALVPADAAAVVFTRHPVTGRDDQLLVTTIRGLGEPMVAGTATPDTIVIDRATRRTLEFIAGDPGERLVARDGGVETIVDEAAEPALSDAALAELVDLALRAEGAFGAPVDIEAAHAGGEWYLLQARPITTR